MCLTDRSALPGWMRGDLSDAAMRGGDSGPLRGTEQRVSSPELAYVEYC